MELERTLNIAEENKVDLNEQFREQIQTTWVLLKVGIKMRCDEIEVIG